MPHGTPHNTRSAHHTTAHKSVPLRSWVSRENPATKPQPKPNQNKPSNLRKTRQKALRCSAPKHRNLSPASTKARSQGTAWLSKSLPTARKSTQAQEGPTQILATACCCTTQLCSVPKSWTGSDLTTRGLGGPSVADYQECTNICTWSLTSLPLPKAPKK